MVTAIIILAIVLCLWALVWGVWFFMFIESYMFYCFHYPKAMCETQPRLFTITCAIFWGLIIGHFIVKYW